MTQPNPYNRAFNFSNYQAEHPADPLPAGSLDEELSRVKAVLDQVRTSIAYIQRDDFTLANATVGFDQLKTEINIGVNPPSTWATATNYVARDSVFHNQKFYICDVSHVSGTFDTDLAAGKWSEIADFTAAQSANLVTYNNSTSGIAATDLQAAVDDIARSINVSSIFGRAGAVVAVAGDYTAAQVSVDASGLAHTTATTVQAAVADHDAAITSAAASVPTGTVLDFAGATAPTGYLMCYGQTVSRTTYAALFAAIGTAHGAGDGSTTFTLPDARGRTIAGKDNMGGTVAGRLASSVAGTTLGAAGGEEKHALTEAELASHNHGGTTSTGGAHTHSYTDSYTTTGGSGVGSGTQLHVTTATLPTGSAGDHSHTIATAGSGTAHNNVQPTLILNKIIKT